MFERLVASAVVFIRLLRQGARDDEREDGGEG
jgi:hypothetical protein